MKIKILFVIGLLLVISNGAFAQDAAFTYQGRLAENGDPYTGTAEFQPTLWDSGSEGTQIAAHSPVSLLVSVTNGLFVLPLDFGSSPFSEGAERWLQLEVRTSIGDFTTLAPRQKLTSTPYAISASTLTGTLPASQLTGSVPGASLAGTYSGAVTFDNPVNSFFGNGTGLTSLNADALITGTIPAAALGNAWQIGGNAGTSELNFLGTADNQPLEIKVNNDRVFRFEPAPEVPNVIGGSRSNVVVTGTRGATIAGGGLPLFRNEISGDFGAIGGGTFHVVSSPWGTIAGGRDNRVYAEAATVAGGRGNIVRTNSSYSTIAGGVLNRIEEDAFQNFIGGGGNNSISNNAVVSVIAGGSFNRIGSNTLGATISGGQTHEIQAGASRSVIAGGLGNIISNNAAYATIGGGQSNRVSENEGTVGGGVHNQALGFSSTVGGGGGNVAKGAWTLIGGGRDNVINTNAHYATIAGGDLNVVATNAEYATVAGGRNNQANAPYSFAAGRSAQANHPGAWVWADSAGGLFESTATNQFNIRAAGGVRIQSNLGIQLNAADAPFITRTFDRFETNAPASKQGHGRWGLFMEPSRLTLGIPSDDVPGRYFQVAKYETNGAYSTLFQVDQSGIVSANGFVGTGSGLTGLNAEQLNGLTASSFLRSDTTSTLSLGSLEFGIGTKILADGGTAVAPSYSFNGDPDTGIYRPVANTIVFSTGGTERLRVSSSGNIGVGNNNPNAKVHIGGVAGSDGIRFPDNTLQTTAPIPVFQSGAGNNPASTNDFLSVTVTVTVNSSSQKILVNSNKAFGSTVGADSLALYIGYRPVGASAAPTTVGGGILGNRVGANMRVTMGLSGVISGLPAGTYHVGLVGSCGSNAANWNSNDWSYTTATVF